VTRAASCGRRFGWTAFGAYVTATAAYIAYIVSREPFSFDAWNVAIDTGAKPITVGRFFAYWRYEYAHSNPRLGQPLTYLAYKLGGFAEVATPVAFIALTLAIAVLGLGRFPRRGRDLAAWAIAIGFCWFALPQIGRNMFCRSYAANYVYTAAIVVWFLVPLRAGYGRSMTDIVSYAMAGALTGMCNEHTGPALIVFLVAYALWLRRTQRPAGMPLAGAIGVVIGFCALVLAPGQDERYGGLAHRHGVIGQVLERGMSGALDLVGDYLVYAAPLLVIVVMLYALAPPGDDASERRARVLLVLAIAAGAAVAGTLCASPKLGSRFFIAPAAILLAGVIALVDARARSARQLAPLVVLAVGAAVYAAAQTIPLYRAVSAQGEARMAALRASTPGTSLVVVPLEQLEESWWFIGDDFRDPKKRTIVARYFALTRVTLRGRRGD
jgi:hypothetical protein